MLEGSEAWKAKVAEGWLVGLLGIESRRTSGAVGSMVQENVAAVASVLPAASVAATVKEWLPGRERCRKPGWCRRRESRRPGCTGRTSRASVEWNVKEAEVLLVGLVGPLSMTVSGAVVSMDQV